MSADPLLSWRDQFPILEKWTYLISHSLGAMPRGVYDELRTYADVWATRGIAAWEDGWWEMVVETGDLVGRLIGAEPASLSMHQNVTLAQAIIASCLDFTGTRRKIVTTDLEFPSLLYLYHSQARRGTQIEVVQSEDGVTVETGRLVDAIDESTALIAVSHVTFRSSFRTDVESVVERAQKVGALTVLDCYHSAGVMPFSVSELGVDFAVGGSIKWLCGGPGAAYLYVRPDLRPRLEPTITGWMAHTEPFAFEPGPIRYRDDAARFLNGTPQIAGLYAARTGIRLIGEAGVEAIREKSARQTSRLIELADRANIPVQTPRDPEQRGGMVTLDPPQAEAVTEELFRRGYQIDHRPGAGIRIAPHFYNTDEEVEAVIGEMEEIIRHRRG